MKDFDHVYIASLVVRAQNDDSNAFAELYALTYKDVYNYACHYLKDEYLAQDAVQDTFISAFKKLKTLKEPTVFVAWLNQISFHTCYKLAKKRNENYGTIDDELLNLVSDENISRNPEHKTVLESGRKILHNAIDLLPVVQRQVIILRYFNNMKIDEIVAITNLSKSTVRRYLTTAQDTLKQKLTDEGGI